ncbi:MAG: hypothetical protein ABEI58_00590 [Candidatus Nanohaloarchaea archaeon]
MAVHSEAYSTERYLAALSIFGSTDLQWLTVEDVNAHADIEPDLEPEIESLEEMGVLEKLYASGENVTKYRPTPDYTHDAARIARFFEAEYGDGLEEAVYSMDREDIATLTGEINVVELLS